MEFCTQTEIYMNIYKYFLSDHVLNRKFMIFFRYYCMKFFQNSVARIFFQEPSKHEK